MHPFDRLSDQNNWWCVDHVEFFLSFRILTDRENIVVLCSIIFIAFINLHTKTICHEFCFPSSDFSRIKLEWGWCFGLLWIRTDSVKGAILPAVRYIHHQIMFGAYHDIRQCNRISIRNFRKCLHFWNYVAFKISSDFY